MQIQALKTSIIKPGQDLWPVIRTALQTHAGGLSEQTVLAISSKIISYAQNRLVAKTAEDLKDPEICKAHKQALVRQEAEWYLEPDESQYQLMFALKNGTLTVNAGIDESNAFEDAFVLWPENLAETLAVLWQKIRTEFQIQELGLVVTDSKTYPLRWGVTATCLAHCGFEALHDCRGQTDLFGRTMQMEQVNVAEAIAISAGLEMGEVAEQTPLALVSQVMPIKFQARPPSPAELKALIIDPKDDFFAPMLSKVSWKKGGS